MGQLHREGTTYNIEAIEIYDHDWPTLAGRVAIPHGIYDIAQNRGYIQLGTSRDTTEFACDAIYFWWQNRGAKAYPNATSPPYTSKYNPIEHRHFPHISGACQSAIFDAVEMVNNSIY